MLGKLTVFFGSVVAMPIVGQLSPETSAGELAKAGAQGILALVVVAETLAIYKMFKLWRNDIDTERLANKEQTVKFEDLMSKHTEAMTKQAASNEQIATAVHRNADVIEKCKHE